LIDVFLSRIGVAHLSTHQVAPFTREEGRKFGVTVGIAFMVLAGVLRWHDKITVSFVLGGIGIALLLAGLLIPGQLRPVYRAWMGFALLLSKVTTPIFMGIIYFILFLITGLLRRMLGTNQLLPVETNGSYWVARERTRANLERQF